MIRRMRYQYYTNVNYLTCEECLSWHGQIRRRRDAFPESVDGCESSILPIPGKRLKHYRRQGQRMQLRAQQELARRSLFHQASERIEASPDEALELLARSATLDLYLPEIENLVAQQQQVLQSNPELRDRLRVLFVKAYSDKFGWRRYERLPEIMRIQRERAGIDRINELLR